MSLLARSGLHNEQSPVSLLRSQSCRIHALGILLVLVQSLYSRLHTLLPVLLRVRHWDSVNQEQGQDTTSAGSLLGSGTSIVEELEVAVLKAFQKLAVNYDRQLEGTPLVHTIYPTEKVEHRFLYIA